MNTKSLSADMTPNEGAREMLVKITSSAIDRDGEVLLPAGMDAKEFRKNPIVFANHEYGVRDVVGKVIELMPKPDHWLAKVFMLPRPPDHDGEWMPDTILHMAKFGIMGVSVGFQPMESRNPTDKDRKAFGEDVGKVYSKWKLLELSIAPLPANQDALILAVSKGLKRETAHKFWPKVMPASVKPGGFSLAGAVHGQWKKAEIAMQAKRQIETEISWLRGRVRV